MKVDCWVCASQQVQQHKILEKNAETALNGVLEQNQTRAQLHLITNQPKFNYLDDVATNVHLAKISFHIKRD